MTSPPRTTLVFDGVDSRDRSDRKMTNKKQMIQHSPSRRGLVQEDEKNDDVVVVRALYSISIRLFFVVPHFDSIDASLLKS